MKIQNFLKVLLIATHFLILLGQVNVGSGIITDSNIISSSHTGHEPIVIDQLSDFAYYGFPGNGSESDPYRIEHLDISAPLGGHCITMFMISAYYIISDCILHGSTDDDTSALYIYENSYGVISGCQIYNSSIGIEIEDYFWVADDIVIQDTKIYDFSYVGVLMTQTSNIKLENVTILQYQVGLSSDYGVRIENSKNISFVECKFSNHTGAWGAGILSMDSIDIDIQRCSFFGASHIQFERNNSNITVSDCTLIDSQLVVTNKNNNGSILIDHNYLRLYYTDWQWSWGVLISCNESTTVVRDNLIVGYKVGIQLQDHSDTIYQNSIIDCSSRGIFVTGNCNKVNNNTLLRCGSGISITGNNNSIRNNSLYSNDIGIELWQFFSDCINNTLFYNWFISNTESATDDGIQNTWDDSESLGNYWDDFPSTYSGVYTIEGSAESIDRWPVYIGDLFTSTTFSNTTDELPNDLTLVIFGAIGGIACVAVVLIVYRMKRVN